RERRESSAVVLEPLVAEQAHATEQIAALVLVEHALPADVEGPHELTDLVARLVDDLEHARGALAKITDVEQAFDQLARLGVVLAQTQDVLEVPEHLFRHVEPIEVNLPEGQLDVERLLLGRHLEPSLEQVRQLLPPLLALVELLEGVESRRV